MIIIMLGAPASGKGTQSAVVAQKLGIPHISTGDIFRWNIANNTPIGAEAKKYIDKGLLVPDELTINILRDRIEMEDCKDGFVLDGYPRTINQQESLDKMLEDCGKSIDMAINLVVTDEEVVRRISGRRMCKCGKAYHIVTYPSKKPDICDLCNGELYTRKDDTVEVANTRLDTYKKQSEPIIGVYMEKGILVDIDGHNPQDKVSEDVLYEIHKYSSKQGVV
ncbi:MAG: adenylate kinase [Clostridia bacterium]|nr:adenylate kinase [Clostridia bacterium]MDD3092545.1 adenylate kinase [Clostridia bacterium]MDD3971238.1 adenylate kinase [Clostridia bacterium]NLF36741.1 adenylate kinase [Clostridiaceae bacterium]